MPRKAASRTSKPSRGRLLLLALAAVWLALMIVASAIGYEHKSPVRIENWKPSPP